MASPRLYVVFYRPRYGNYQHWALYLQTDADNLIFEVTDSHPNFKRNVVKADPRNSQSFVSMMFLDTVNSSDIATMQKVAKTTEIDNETVEWDCQEYVLDMLETYKKAKKELMKKRGAIV